MNSASSSGIGLGTVLAVVFSYETHHDGLWAFVHGICSWFYVLYWACGGGQ